MKKWISAIIPWKATRDDYRGNKNIRNSENAASENHFDT